MLGGRLEAASVSPISMDSGLHEDVERNNAKSKSLDSRSHARPLPIHPEKVIKARDAHRYREGHLLG